jgi:hypothetical protein
VAEHPDLADVTRPATAPVIDAFIEANGLATEHYPGAQHAERFIRAVQGAQRAWQVAVDTARHSGIPVHPARVSPALSAMAHRLDQYPAGPPPCTSPRPTTFPLIGRLR